MESPKHTLTFKPAICQPRKDKDGNEVAAEFSGTITLRIPNYSERLELYERSGINMAEQIEKAITKGEGTDVETADESAKDIGRRGFEQMKFMAKIAPEYVVKVDITRVADGYKFESFDDLAYDSDASMCIAEIGPKILGKYSVGKPQAS